MSVKFWFATVTAVALAAGSAFAQPDNKKHAAPAAGGAHEPPAKGEQPGADDMAMWAEMAKPVEQHERFKDMAGTWDAEVKVWMDPSQAEPSVSKGTMVNTLTHGGRYVHHDFKGSFLEQPFTGSGDLGYNKVTGKYEGTWMDSMGTAIMFSSGTYDEKTKTYTSNATFDMPGPDGKPMKVTQRETVQVISPDKHVMTMYHSADMMPKEMKVLEITYTRAGKGGAAAPAAEKPKAPAAK